jgi:hypothetical protein
MSEQKIASQNGKLDVSGRALRHEASLFGRIADSKLIIGEGTANYISDVDATNFLNEEEN